MITEPLIDDLSTKKDLLDYLLQLVTEKRKILFDDVLRYRTRHITIVLEDIYQSQNASAVLRTCDLTGIQDVHIIENNYEYSVNPDVALGSSKWLTMTKYNERENNTLDAFNKLRSSGYKIVATSPHKNDKNLNSLSLNDKVAIVLGTELTGLSSIAIDNADEYLQIPMYGFTESYNISVSAALILFTLTERLRSSDIDWKLFPEEVIDIKLDWAKKSIDRSDVVIRHFLKNYNSKINH
jgi:tRNA (guanosine-2'-O-)-methyltransferase